MAMPLSLKSCATAAEAAAALGAERGARYLGGGTLVMRDVNEGDLSFSTLVRSTDRALTRLETSGQRIVIGAGVTYAAILAQRELTFLHPVARSIGGPAVRNMGTIGGNLFAPSPFGDFATALLALDAMVQLQGGYSPREIALEEFLAARERNQNGLVAAVAAQRPASAEAFRYVKIARVKPKGAAVLTIAAHIPVSGGRVNGARIAFGAMGATPLRAKSAERALEGRALDAQSITAAAAAVLEGLSPADDALASAWYRREVAGVHLRRLLGGGS
jgi:CO/xanthine dehydrogenase FAD-binding subunit